MLTLVKPDATKRPAFIIKTASQDLSTTGLERCLPASSADAIHDWFLLSLFFLGSQSQRLLLLV
jgi:hypothetical protein